MKRILFSGYAHVHFVCFLPVYQRLAADPRVELYLSGGFRTKQEGAVSYSLDGFYDPFPVNHERVIPIEQAREEDFDVLVCAHLSDALFPRHASKTVQIFHGVSFKNLAVRDKALRFDLLCLPGRYHAELYRDNGLIRDNGSTCLITGFPKADAMVNGGPSRDKVLQSAGVDPRLPTILLATTGEKHNGLETMGESVIGALRDEGSCNVLVKPHDHPKRKIDWFERLAPLENDRVQLVRDNDVVPYLRAADLLMTDASSVAVEYTLLNRPIVFLDVPKLFSIVRKKAPAFDLETYGRKIGTVVEQPEDVVRVVAESLAHPERHQGPRTDMAQHVFHNPGHASDRVAGVVLHAAGLEPSIPEDVEILN